MSGSFSFFVIAHSTFGIVARIRSVFHRFEQRKIIAQRLGDPAPRASPLEEAAVRVHELSEVQNAMPLIVDLETVKLTCNEAAHPAPSTAEFMTFAQEMGITAGIRDDLVVRER